ncbi:MAG: radical SAM protein [Candidatus Bathycorpusculaceae bacterium]
MFYDPVQRHLAVEKLVTRISSEGQERKYYRIRKARWYGGIITADCVGCGLICKFCWVSDAVMFHPTDVGRFYTSTEVASDLISLAKKCGLKLLRVSGGEPTIGKRHLLQLLDKLQGTGFRFILETNGILIAHDESYAAELSNYDFIHVRVSLKGCNKQEFAMLTGAKPEGFESQLKALQNLMVNGVSSHPSVMASFSSKESLRRLVQTLGQISTNFADELEVEELILYPRVIEKLKRYGLKYFIAHAPDKVPPEQV